MEHLDGQLPHQDPRQLLKILKSDHPLGFALTKDAGYPKTPVEAWQRMVKVAFTNKNPIGITTNERQLFQFKISMRNTVRFRKIIYRPSEPRDAQLPLFDVVEFTTPRDYQWLHSCKPVTETWVRENIGQALIPISEFFHFHFSDYGEERTAGVR